MNLLVRLERFLEGAVEGLFRRGQGPVQPTEIARRLVREMEDHRRVSLGRVLVPNVYVVYLPPEDLEELTPFLATLQGELVRELDQAAAKQGHYLLGPLEVRLEAETRKGAGPLRIEARFAQEKGWGTGRPAGALLPQLAPERPEESEGLAGSERAPGRSPAAEAEPWGNTRIFAEGRARLAGKATVPRQPQVEALQLTVVEGPDAGLAILAAGRVEIGRGARADLRLSDPRVSRRHAALLPDGSGWRVRDLDSTNGTCLNGRPVREAPLRPGDRLQVGGSVIEVRQAP